MAESEAEQRAVAKAEIMAAARHLTVAQLRWIAESFATGKSFLNCPKGRIAESLSYDFEGNRHRIGRSGVVAPEKLAEICANLRWTRGKKTGVTRLRKVDLPWVEKEIARLEGLIAEWAGKDSGKDSWLSRSPAVERAHGYIARLRKAIEGVDA